MLALVPGDVCIARRRKARILVDDAKRNPHVAVELMHGGEISPAGPLGDIALLQLDDGLGIPEEGVVPPRAQLPGVVALACHDVAPRASCAETELAERCSWT